MYVYKKVPSNDEVRNSCVMMIEVNDRVVITRNLTRTNSTCIGDGTENESVSASYVTSDLRS